MNWIVTRYLVGLCTFMLVLAWGHAGWAGSSDDRQTTAAEVRAEIDDALKAIGNYSAEQRDAALAKAKDSLEKTDKRIEQLQEQIDRKWATMSDSAREQARKALNTLRQERTKLAEWYGGLKHSSANAWEEIKKGFTKSYQELENSLAKAREEY